MYIYIFVLKKQVHTKVNKVITIAIKWRFLLTQKVDPLKVYISLQTMPSKQRTFTKRFYLVFWKTLLAKRFLKLFKTLEKTLQFKTFLKRYMICFLNVVWTTAKNVVI